MLEGIIVESDILPSGKEPVGIKGTKMYNKSSLDTLKTRSKSRTKKSLGTYSKRK